MAIEVRLPQVGESVTEAVIGKWLRKPGDHVEKFDPLVEVVTDKVSMEFPSPQAGTIVRIIQAEGATVPMGAVIAEMEPDEPGGPDDSERIDRVGRIVADANVGPTGGVFADASAAPSTTSVAHGPGGPSVAPAARRPATPPAPAASPAAGRDQAASRAARLSPVVVNLAAQHGVDLATVTGTGAGGRVTKQDVMAAVAARAAGGAEQDGSGDRVIEPSPVRKIIAARMVRSASEIPHAWTAVEVDVSGMVACRAAHREEFRRRHGADLSYVAFSVLAIAGALKANPMVNSTWENGKIRVRGSINIGVAVAAPQGLVVPVLRNADRLTIAGIAVALEPLVERARTDRLSAEDVRDGTFTLNNTGALGSVLGKAIINYPQAAILNTEAIVKRPVVVAGVRGDEIVVRPMMNLTLSFDHRVLDGSDASRFILEVRRRVEEFSETTRLE
jgi:pyruvate/2-oxoglutarate dehydrogenase complex dihydrolipoamide acyltransferase (E2) component